LDQLTGPQITEWEAYDKIDPIGKWRDDFRGAKLESLVVNIVQQLYAKKGVKPIITTALDFMPDWLGEKREEPKQQSVEEMKQVLLSLAAYQNKKERIAEPIKMKPPSFRKPDKFQGQ